MTGKPGHASTRAGASLEALLTRRHEALASQYAAARRGDVEGVHQARVASRRLREAVPVLAAGLAGDVRVKPIRRRLRDLTRALGAVRELDVAIEMLGEIGVETPDAERLRDVWVRRLEGQRRKPARSLHKVLASRDRKWLESRLAHLIDVRAESEDAEWTAALARRLSRRARALADRIDRTGALYHPEPLHDVRIAGKKLRYVLELAADTGLITVARPLRTLKTAQEALGRLHDLDVLLGTLREVPEASQGEVLQAAAEKVAVTLELESRWLHARYLRSRSALLRVSELTLRTVVPAVRRRRPARSADKDDRGR